MSQKSLTIIIVLIIFALLLGGGIYYYFFLNNTNNNSGFSGSDVPDLFPSDQIDGNNNTGESSENNPYEPEENIIPKYSQISTLPVAGATFIQNKDGQNMVRFVDRATGHIYDYDITSQNKERVINTTIPKIQEVVWSKDGDELIFRYLDTNNEDIISYYTKIPTEVTPETETEGRFLSKNILFPNISKSDTLFYIEKTNEGSRGITSKIDGTKKIEVFSSPLTEWLGMWFSNNILLTTKASSDTEGFSYVLNKNNGVIRSLIREVDGLTTLPKKDGSKILYSSGSDNSINLFTYSVEKGETVKMKQSTLSEKCAWSSRNTDIVYCAIPKELPDEEYPDSWYKGIVSFNDNLWLINTKLNLGSVILNPSFYSQEPIDAIELKLSLDENYLTFINKKDLTLWLLEL